MFTLSADRQAIKTKTMKRIFTLIFALAVFTAADAQRGSKNKRGDNDRYNNRNVVIDDGRYDNRDNRYRNNPYNAQRSMQMEIARINQKYDHKIHDTWDDHHMRNREKRKMVRHLEQERQDELNRVYARNRNRGGENGRVHIHY